MHNPPRWSLALLLPFFGVPLKGTALITATIDTVAFDHKPSDAEKAKITGRMITDNGTVAELAQAIIDGYTWCPGVFIGAQRKNETWIQQEVFALDIDSGLSFDAFIARVVEYDVYPAFVYTTFSSVDNDKYRAVFVSPTIITVNPIRYAIQLALMAIFPESDVNCKDAARMYYGGKSLIHEDYDARLDIAKLFEAVWFYYRDTDPSHVTRNIERFCQRVGINVINGLPDVRLVDPGADDKSGSFDHHSYNISYSTGAEISQTLHFSFTSPREITDDKIRYAPIAARTEQRPELIRNVDWDNLPERCIVYREFMHGIDKHHDVTFFVACNLIHLEGGEAKFFEGLQRREVYDLDKWRATIEYIKKRGYKPVSYAKIAEYYPDASLHAAATTLVEAAHLPLRGVNVYDPPVFEPLPVVEERMILALQTALARTEPGVVVVRVDTGVGKTEKILEAISTEKPLLIAVPTHTLKGEIQQRAMKLGKEVLVSPAPPRGLTPYQQDTIDRLYRVGAVSEANVEWRELAANNPAIAEYVAAKDCVAHAHDKTVITTHARLPYLDTQHDTIVIDEDILPTLLPIGQTSVADLEQLAELVNPKGFGRRQTNDGRSIISIFEFVQQAPDGQVQVMPNYMLEDIRTIEKAVANSQIKSNVLGFLDATHFICNRTTEDSVEVHFIYRRYLPNKNIIILSATANQTIYERLCNPLVFIDTGRAQLCGTLRQDVRFSYSRSRLNRNESLIPRAASIAGNQAIITYKEFESHFKNVAATFGGLAGIDSLRGQDITIIGTPHVLPYVYLLRARALGIEINEQDYGAFPLKRCRVRRNGYEYYFMTYPHNSLLREIQLDMIESDLLQAIGRARLVRNQCCVTVLSNLPIPGAEFVQFEDDKDKGVNE